MNKKTAILIGVSAAAFLGPFTQTIYTPSLPEMKDFFGVTTVMIPVDGVQPTSPIHYLG